MSRAGAGQADEHWIAQAYDAMGPALYRHALMILSDPGLAEDVVQTAFIRLLARGHMDDITSTQAFLRVIVRNEAFRLLARRRPTESLESAQAQLLEPMIDAPEQRDEHRQLEQAMGQLSPEQREVIHLKIYEQLTFLQIAELLGLSQNTVASRYRYAIGRLRDSLSRRET